MSISYFRENHNTAVFFSQTINYPPHLHDGFEIMLVSSGEGDVFCDGIGYRLKEGDAFIAYPNQVHYYENFENSRGYVLIFPINFIDDAQRYIREMRPKSPAVHIKKFERASRLFNMLYEIWEEKKDKLAVKYFVNALLGMLMEDFTMLPAGKQRATSAELVMSYLSEHFKEKVAVDTVAKALFISKSTVSRIFSQRLKISFNDYVNLLRLNEFFNIYENEKCSITAAALSAGFPTVRTFNNVFMKHYGISPSEYVKNKK